MHIARTVEDIEHLAGLSNRAKKRIVTALTFLLAIESYGSALSTAAGADYGAVEVEGQPTQAKSG